MFNMFACQMMGGGGGGGTDLFRNACTLGLDNLEQIVFLYYFTEHVPPGMELGILMFVSRYTLMFLHYALGFYIEVI